MLLVFNQNLVAEDRHELNYDNENLNPLAKKTVYRLNWAVADKELMMGLNIVDEIERTYGREMNELNDQSIEKDNEIEKLKREIEKLKRGQ